MRRALPIASLLLASAGAAAAEERPNILFILVDDLRPAIGAYGDPVAITPNIDRLAAEGRIFQRAYVQQAVCGPSRASMLTGLLPDRTGVWDNRTHFRSNIPGVVTLPEYFKANGYATYGYGKVFHNHLFEDPQSWSVPNRGANPGWRRYAAPENLTGELKEAPVESLDVVDEAYSDGMIAAWAEEALRHAPEPFFMAVGFHKPHLPFTAPKKYWDLYDPAAIPLPGRQVPPEGAASHAYPDRHRELEGYRGIQGDGRLSEEQVRELRHGYYACISFVDTLVGRLLEAVEQRGGGDNTIVVLWGDHGYHIGEHGYWTKTTNFDLDARSPLIVRAPNIAEPGAGTEGLVEAVDIFPTLVELAGLPPPESLDGVSLVPLLEDPGETVRDHALSQFPRPWMFPRGGEPRVMGYSIRTDDFRYTAWLDFSTRDLAEAELYDYRADILEARNLIDDPAYVPVRSALEATFARVMAERLGHAGLAVNSPEER